MTIPEILSHYSALGYSAGDVLSTGTVSGVAGFKSRTSARSLYLKPGDVIEAEIERIGVLRNPVISWQEGHGEPAPPRVRPGATVTLGARRREARPRPRADGGARARRARRARARQRPLPDELLGHEGLRRVRVPARGRAGADLPRGLGGGRGAHGVDEGRALRPRLRTRRPAAAAGAHARRWRSRRRASYGRVGLELSLGHAGLRPDGRRADDVHEGLVRRLAGRGTTRRRCSLPARALKTRAGDRADAARERDLRRGDGARARRARGRG